MRHYKRLIPALMACMALFSCVDDDKPAYSVDKPQSIADLEYLNKYAPLKSYVDFATNPGFKLGAGVGVGDYASKGVMYRLINSNFNDVTAGWEMKHGAVVQGDGRLDFELTNSLIASAKEAGVSVYGHTLCWHANQNAKYLNSLIVPTITPPEPLDPETVEYLQNGDFSDGKSNWNGGRFDQVIVVNGGGNDGSNAVQLSSDGQYEFWSWSYQFVQGLNPVLVDGVQAKLSFWIKGEKGEGDSQGEGQINVGIDNGGAATAFSEQMDISFADGWRHIERTFPVSGDGKTRFCLGYGKFDGNILLSNISLTQVIQEEGGAVLEENLITESEFESGSIGGWFGWGGDTAPSLSDDGDGYEGGHALKLHNDVARDAEHKSQVTIALTPNLKLESKYVLELWAKGSTDGKMTPCIRNAETYNADNYSSVNITTEWKRYELSVIATKDNRNSFLISYGSYAGTIFIDNITLRRLNPDGSSSVEKTPEEKKEIIGAALDTWISGMVKNCKDYVKAWDVVNEPMDDGSPYDLKTGIGKTLKDDEFYWQDYLGKDYAVTAFQLAAQYGNQDDKLFINDYNLEYSLDKCKGLIQYVEYIESKGARVDGIGTQMHVSVGGFNKERVVEMFKLLAATGKLIKISELDMGIRNGVNNSNVTKEELDQQAELYQFIIDKYFELIPAAQRYGITIWSPLDSPDGSSWRKNEPIGLWTLDYKRKPAYGGVSNGFAGRDVSQD